MEECSISCGSTLSKLGVGGGSSAARRSSAVAKLHAEHHKQREENERYDRDLSKYKNACQDLMRAERLRDDAHAKEVKEKDKLQRLAEAAEEKGGGAGKGAGARRGTGGEGEGDLVYLLSASASDANGVDELSSSDEDEEDAANGGDGEGGEIESSRERAEKTKRMRKRAEAKQRRKMNKKSGGGAGGAVASLTDLLETEPLERKETDLHAIALETNSFSALFTALPWDNMMKLSRHMYTKVVSAGTRIYRQGDAANKFYVLLEGAVSERTMYPG